jgi:signal transduction histidine kinase
MHHLGAPLATIACSLKALSGLWGNLSDEDRQTLIASSLDRVHSMHVLSQKLLCLEGVRATGRLAEKRPVRAAEILGSEVNARIPEARQRRLTLILDLRNEETLVMADPDGLRLVFGNLLDNAIKYSEGKGEKIEASAVIDGNDLLVRVRDEGIGIPAEDRSRLFREFQRAGNASKSAAPGFGLGLAIVKELVDCYGGAIELESELGVGTSVTVRLPIVPVDTVGKAAP